MASKRDIPPRKTLSKENLLIRGVPAEYIEGTLRDYVQDDEYKDFFKKYLSNLHLMYEDRVNLCLYGANGTGKAQPLDELVLTPKGFVKMGELKVGDYVIDEHGKPTKILNIFPQGMRPVYEVTFDTGVKVRCDKDHLWKFKNRNMISREQDWQVDTLENILNRFKIKRGKGNNIAVPISKAVEFNNDKELPIHPYLLGVLIADGYLSGTTPSISTTELDIIEKCKELIPENHYIHKNSDFNTSWNIGCKGGENLINKHLKEMGLKVTSSEKFIPKEYLITTKENRLELLRGLMDTDGCIRKSGSFTYSTISNQLKDDVVFLANSLGYKTVVTKDKRAKYSSGVCFNITIMTNDLIFSTKKQIERYKKFVKPTYKKHIREISYITDVRYIGEEECQCIMVDNKDHTYVTRGFIVTHNTFLSSLIVKEGYRLRYKTVLITMQGLIDLYFKPNKTEEDWERIKMIREADFLVIDELGKENFTKTGSNINLLEETLRNAVTKGQVVIICTNLPLEGEGGLYHQYGASIKSLIDGSFVKLEFDNSDYRPIHLNKKRAIKLLRGEED